MMYYTETNSRMDWFWFFFYLFALLPAVSTQSVWRAVNTTTANPAWWLPFSGSLSDTRGGVSLNIQHGNPSYNSVNLPNNFAGLSQALYVSNQLSILFNYGATYMANTGDLNLPVSFSVWIQPLSVPSDAGCIIGSIVSTNSGMFQLYYDSSMHITIQVKTRDANGQGSNGQFLTSPVTMNTNNVYHIVYSQTDFSNAVASLWVREYNMQDGLMTVRGANSPSYQTMTVNNVFGSPFSDFIDLSYTGIGASTTRTCSNNFNMWDVMLYPQQLGNNQISTLYNNAATTVELQDVCQPTNPCSVSYAYCNNTLNNAYTCLCPGFSNGGSCFGTQPCAAGQMYTAVNSTSYQCANPCLNGGIYTGNGTTLQCSCPSTFSGLMCQYTTCNNLAAPACYNGGVCTNSTTQNATCTCPASNSGPNCQYATCSNVATPTCYNGGACMQSSSLVNASCSCSNGFTGNNCTTQTCSSPYLSCANSATCIAGTYSSNATCACYNNGSFNSTTGACSCVTGWSGISCQDFTCQNTALAPVCYNGGNCTQYGNLNTNATCSCTTSYNGPNCQYTTCSNPTAPVCVNGGTCSQLSSTSNATCTCPTGYTGSTCSVQTCSSPQLPCANSATCISGNGTTSATCACYNGGIFNGTTNQCVCATGWSGQSCQNIQCNNPLAPSCLNNGTCIQASSNSNATCSCASGYSGTTCTAMTCTNTHLGCANTTYCSQANSTVNATCSCLNGGTYTTNSTYTYCTCPNTYSGTACQARTCNNTRSYCYNGGMCSQPNVQADSFCTCPDHYSNRTFFFSDQCSDCGWTTVQGIDPFTPTLTCPTNNTISVVNVFFGCSSSSYSGATAAIQTLCNGRQSCTLSSSFTNDPCPNVRKETAVTYSCTGVGTFTAVTTTSGVENTVYSPSCASGTVYITDAYYGCPSNTAYAPSTTATNAAQGVCNGKTSCSFTAGSTLYGSDPCPYVSKTTSVSYVCKTPGCSSQCQNSTSDIYACQTCATGYTSSNCSIPINYCSNDTSVNPSGRSYCAAGSTCSMTGPGTYTCVGSCPVAVTLPSGGSCPSASTCTNTTINGSSQYTCQCNPHLMGSQCNQPVWNRINTTTATPFFWYQLASAQKNIVINNVNQPGFPDVYSNSFGYSLNNLGGQVAINTNGGDIGSLTATFFPGGNYIQLEVSTANGMLTTTIPVTFSTWFQPLNTPSADAVLIGCQSSQQSCLTVAYTPQMQLYSKLCDQGSVCATTPSSFTLHLGYIYHVVVVVSGAPGSFVVTTYLWEYNPANGYVTALGNTPSVQVYSIGSSSVYNSIQLSYPSLGASNTGSSTKISGGGFAMWDAILYTSPLSPYQVYNMYENETSAILVYDLCAIDATCAPHGFACVNNGSNRTVSCVCPGYTNNSCSGISPCTNGDLYLATNTSSYTCIHNPCMNNQTFIRNSNNTSGRCSCSQTYNGDYCQYISCNQGGVQCFNDGYCIQAPSANASCICAQGFSGVNCLAQTCDSTVCYNGGICSQSNPEINATCSCSSMFSGSQCQAATCNQNQCNTNEICAQPSTELNATCVCRPGYSGVDCQAITCSLLTCNNSGVCVQSDVNNNATCQCTGGYTGRECLAAGCSITSCLHGAQCVQSTIDSNAYCVCANGFTGPSCAVVGCGGIDSPVCLNGGTCFQSNTTSSSVCQCPSGYTGDLCEVYSCGTVLAPICQHDGQCEQVSPLLNATCNCNSANYSGTLCQATTCAQTKCSNNGTCIQPSVETDAICVCPYGYSGNTCSATTCAQTECSNGGTCIQPSVETDATCVCPYGYSGNTCSATTCETLNCMNGGNCTQMLSDLNATCSCANSYTGRLCEIATCNSPEINCGLHGTCLQPDSSISATCVCDPGWLDTTCNVAADPCAVTPCLNGGTCSATSIGISTEYTCLCTSEYTGVHCETQLQPCLVAKCNTTHSVCNPDGAGYTCVCNSGYLGATCNNQIPVATVSGSTTVSAITIQIQLNISYITYLTMSIAQQQQVILQVQEYAATAASIDPNQIHIQVQNNTVFVAENIRVHQLYIAIADPAAIIDLTIVPGSAVIDLYHAVAAIYYAAAASPVNARTAGITSIGAYTVVTSDNINPASTTDNNSNSSFIPIIAGAAGGGSLLMLVIVYILYRHHRERQKGTKASTVPVSVIPPKAASVLAVQHNEKINTSKLKKQPTSNARRRKYGYRVAK